MFFTCLYYWNIEGIAYSGLIKSNFPNGIASCYVVTFQFAFCHKTLLVLTNRVRLQRRKVEI